MSLAGSNIPPVLAPATTQAIAQANAHRSAQVAQSAKNRPLSKAAATKPRAEDQFLSSAEEAAAAEALKSLKSNDQEESQHDKRRQQAPPKPSPAREPLDLNG